MLDLKITGGLLIDSAGREPYSADISIKDGKIAEHWGVFDAAGMMGQLGMH